MQTGFIIAVIVACLLAAAFAGYCAFQAFREADSGGDFTSLAATAMGSMATLASIVLALFGVAGIVTLFFGGQR